jgi:uncharacterized membrane protein
LPPESDSGAAIDETAASAAPAPDAQPLAPLVRGLALLGGAGASLGFAGWAFRSNVERFTKYALSNEIPSPGRMYALGNMAAGAMVLVLVGIAVFFARRRRDGAALCERLGRRLAPLTLAGLLPVLLNVRLWPGRELTVLVALTIFGLGLQRLARMSLLAGPVLPDLAPSSLRVFFFARDRFFDRLAPLTRPHAGRVAFGVVLAAAAGYAWHFAHHTLQTHYRMGTASLDLGLEDNLIWNILDGAPLFKSSPLGGPDSSHAGFHQTWFAYVIAPIYFLFPGARTLLVIQAVMIAAAAIPLFLLARRRLGYPTAVILAVGYLLYPPLHGANLYDFHYQPLSAVFLFSTLYLLETRRDVAAAICILLAFSLREDIAALVAIIGVYLVLTGKRPRAGLAVAIAGGVYFVLLKFAIMPRFLAGSEAFAYMYKNLVGTGEHGFGGVLKTVFANPFYTLGTLLEKDKLVYALQLFAPFAFLPFRRSTGLLFCVPGFFFTMLSTEYEPTIQISFQYTAWWTTFLFIASIAALEHLKVEAKAVPALDFSRRAWVIAFAGATLLASYQYGAILDKSNARGGFGPYRFGLTAEDHVRHKQVHELIVLVPPRAKIAASELLVPQVSTRPDAYTLRHGLFDAEYLLFESPPGGEERERVLDALKNQKFGVMDVRGPFVLAKRDYKQTRNAEVLSAMGE